MRSMKRLSLEKGELARDFVWRHARPLEQSLYSYYFENGSVEDVLTELAGYQNHDGGFGQALEPDLRFSGSSVIATTVGLQMLRELGVKEDKHLVRHAIKYLLDNYNETHRVWSIIPPGVNSAPHAPWWKYDEKLPSRWGGFLANPRAEIVGYLHDYSTLVPEKLLGQLRDEVISYLEESTGEMEMHELLCYIRFAETETLEPEIRTKTLRKLQEIVVKIVARDLSDWEKYVLKPLAVVSSPDSPFATLFEREIRLNLDYEIERQQKDGSWGPNWSWRGEFPEAWINAERDWKGILTLRTLRQLQLFDRLS